MSKQRKPWIELLLRSIPFFVTIALGIGGFLQLSKLRQPPATRETRNVAPLVQVDYVRPGGAELTLVADGEAVPFRQISLAAQVAGRIVDKSDLCRTGRYVPAGEPLVAIDPRDYDLELRRVQELIRQTEISIEELDTERNNTEELAQLARQDLELQRRDLERNRALVEQRTRSAAALDTARRSEIQAVNSLRALENQIRLLSTRRGRLLSEKQRLAIELEKATLDRQRCEIVAPIGGVVVESPIEVDDYVRPGGLLVQLEDTERIEVRFELKLDQLRQIWEANGGHFDPNQGTEASYKLPNLAMQVAFEVGGFDYVWQARLSRYDGAGLNPSTRTLPCLAIVDRPRVGAWSDERAVPPGLTGPPALLRGMFVKVQIQIPATQPLLGIPTIGLRPGNTVWIVRNDHLNVCRVKIAQSVREKVLLYADASNVEAGDSIIISPLTLAVDQMAVRSEPATLPVSTQRAESADARHGPNGSEPGPQEIAR